MLQEMEIEASIIHSFLTQKRRLKSLYSFKNQKTNILLATDVIGRGIDVKTVDLVINYDVPFEDKNFIHRVGRASRGGKSGLAVTLITQYDLERVKKIEERIGEKMELEELEEEAALENLHEVGNCKKKAELDMGSKGETEHFEMLRKRKDKFREMISEIKKEKVKKTKKKIAAA